MKQVCFAAAMACALVVGIQGHAVADDWSDVESPSFSNPAQAAHAANLAAEAATSLDVEIDKAENDVKDATTNLEATRTDLKAAKTDLSVAKTDLEISETTQVILSIRNKKSLKPLKGTSNKVGLRAMAWP